MIFQDTTRYDGWHIYWPHRLWVITLVSSVRSIAACRQRLILTLFLYVPESAMCRTGWTLIESVHLDCRIFPLTGASNNNGKCRSRQFWIISFWICSLVVLSISTLPESFYGTKDITLFHEEGGVEVLGLVPCFRFFNPCSWQKRLRTGMLSSILKRPVELRKGSRYTSGQVENLPI